MAGGNNPVPGMGPYSTGNASMQHGWPGRRDLANASPFAAPDMQHPMPFEQQQKPDMPQPFDPGQSPAPPYAPPAPASPYGAPMPPQQPYAPPVPPQMANPFGQLPGAYSQIPGMLAHAPQQPPQFAPLSWMPSPMPNQEQTDVSDNGADGIVRQYAPPPAAPISPQQPDLSAQDAVKAAFMRQRFNG